MIIKEPKVINHIYQGVIEGNDVQKSIKRYHDVLIFTKNKEKIIQ